MTVYITFVYQFDNIFQVEDTLISHITKLGKDEPEEAYIILNKDALEEFKAGHTDVGVKLTFKNDDIISAELCNLNLIPTSSTEVYSLGILIEEYYDNIELGSES